MFPSFNVSDLVTNDESVSSLLESALSDSPNNSSGAPRMMIAHLLGVDHAGHRFHADHVQMHERLAFVNSLLRNVSQWLYHDEDASRTTLLIVTGDHGMTNAGDHGGGSSLETDTFLFAELFGGSPDCQKTGSTAPEEAEDRDPFKSDYGARFQACKAALPPAMRSRLTVSRQVDLVPTLALMLGLPIPYSNIGRVIPKLLRLGLGVFAHDPTFLVEGALRCNMAQIRQRLPVPHEGINGDGSSVADLVEVLDRLIEDVRLRRGHGTTLISLLGYWVVAACGALGLFCSISCRMLFSGTGTGSRVARLRTNGRSVAFAVTMTAMALARFGSLFSTSFIVEEDTCVFFLLQLANVLRLLARNQRASSTPAAANDESSVSHSKSARKRDEVIGSCAWACDGGDVISVCVVAADLRCCWSTLVRDRQHGTHLTPPAPWKLYAPTDGTVGAMMMPIMMEGLVMAMQCVSFSLANLRASVAPAVTTMLLHRVAIGWFLLGSSWSFLVHLPLVACLIHLFVLRRRSTSAADQGLSTALVLHWLGIVRQQRQQRWLVHADAPRA